MDERVATSFLRFDFIFTTFDTRSSHHLARILSKVCFRGCVFLLSPHQPGGTSVPFASLWCSPLYVVLGIGTLYHILYILRVLGSRTIVDAPVCVCLRCCVAAW